jgi:DNA-directed RNA polymerase beta subunit
LNSPLKNKYYIILTAFCSAMDYDINTNDIFLVGDAEIEEKGLVHHHITSANDLCEIGVPQIITQVFEINMRLDEIRRETDDEKAIDHLIIKVTFSDVAIGKPTLLNYNSGKEEVVFPNTARIKEKTYKATLRIDVKVVAMAIMKNGSVVVREDLVKNFKICKMPIMVGSGWCNTYGLSQETLTQLHEDPSDPGGYYIIKGVEWVVDCVENILFNKVRIFKNEGHKKEMMRAEYISKPGDFYLNSDQFIVRWLTDEQLTIEIRRDKLKDLHIPFYLIFRIMGWNTDKQIFDNLLYDYDTPTSKKILQFLNMAFNAKYTHLPKGRYAYTQSESLQYIAEGIAESGFSYLDVNSFPENYQKITNFILDHLDTHFLQHMGTTMQSRDRKLRFLCVILRKMFLVNLKNMEQTDRDSYNSKRIAAAGVSCAKTFKTHFNATIIQQIKKKLSKDLKTMSFFKIELGPTIRSSVYGTEFERALTQAITAGNKSEITVSKRVRINRLSSQLLNRKNQLNTYATLRQVTATSSASAKQSERANEMRRVHMSFLGYICPTHSPEGEKVGINKQLSIFAFITKASFSEVVKDMLLDDKEIFALNTIDYRDIATQHLCNVYVNGNWIGCCKDALYMAQKYRQMRREFKINPEITIVWDNTQDEVYFWTDAGRIIRPLIIVYNNKRDVEMFKKLGSKVKPGEFYQGLALKQKHIDALYAKTIGTEDLLRDGVIEYISAEEQENMYIAPSFTHLKKDRENELHEYTHCDIPQAMFGITALTSPYAAHNQAQRNVYQCSQGRQTCGVFAKNWPHRADKDTFLQYNNETPIVKTVSNKYLYPNGSNCIVALMCNTGYNQEDSLVINKGAIDRGLFNGCKFTFYKSELDQREEFANPDITTTIDIKSACYDKLVNGIISKGTVIYKNDAIIGKILKITKTTDDSNDAYKYADRSVIYKDDEPAIVHNVIIDRNEVDERFCKVVLRKLRPVSIGDKFSARSGQKGTCGLLLDEADMPRTKEGIAPTIIMNPHSIPSRMTIGQLIESHVSNLCAEKGAQVDATIFKKVDIESIALELENLGLHKYGYKRLYNGITGEFIDCEIFMGPTYYQRLQKFTVDTQYAISSGPSDAITLQPLDGRSNGGGLFVALNSGMNKNILLVYVW